MTATTLWADTRDALSVELERRLDPPVTELLENTVWGSRDLRYRIIGVAEKLARLTDPYIFTLRADDALAAACVLDRKPVTLLSTRYDSVHFVMIATSAAHRGKGFAGLLVEHIRGYLEENLGSPAIAYAYIEATTEFSLRISDRVGHVIEADMPINVFSRLRPRTSDDVVLIRQAEIAGIGDRLSRLYQGHGFADFEQSLDPSAYFVRRRGDEIVAGAQVESMHWSVVELPGWRGEFLVRVLPALPLMNRLLPLSDLVFLRVGNLLVEPGRENEFVDLLEAVLALHGARIALLVMDERSPVLRRIRMHGRLGLLNHALSGATRLVADFKGVHEDDIARIAELPLLMSPRDVF
jgi:GNAT superfamily N-acetyltransferase